MVVLAMELDRQPLAFVDGAKNGDRPLCPRGDEKLWFCARGGGRLGTEKSVPTFRGVECFREEGWQRFHDCGGFDADADYLAD